MKEKVLKLGEDDVEIKQIAEALSSSVRLSILKNLKSKELNHKEIAEQIGKSESSISFHLRYLLDSELITEESKKGILGRIKKVPEILTNKIIIELL